MIGDSFNAAACAVEEFLAATIGKLEEMMQDVLGDIMSGLDWLAEELVKLVDTSVRVLV